MIDCIQRKRAEAALDDLLTLLDESRLREVVCLPLEEAADALERPQAPSAAASNPAAFLGACGRIVQCLYAQGRRPPLLLSEEQAQAEAVFLLDQDYSSQSGLGCVAAYVDYCAEGEEDHSIVLDFLLEAVKRREWRKRVGWLVTCHISLLNWPEKTALTEAAMERFKDLLSPDIATAPPERFADLLPQLLLDWIHGESEFNRILKGPYRNP
ncbi:MAG: hypothetical protein KJ052_17250 [Candidatus Hydrogenedentes bacterium]|nr:hypothetical protein [Candidatus Hydrogenedentota bacterium]